MKSLFLFVSSFCVVLCQAQTVLNEEIDAARSYVNQLQQRMRDPDSFVLERVYRSVIQPLSKAGAKRLGKKAAAEYERAAGSTEFCFEYRARNGFGGMNRGAAQASSSIGLVVFSPGTLDLIGGTCAAIHPEPLTDITREVSGDAEEGRRKLFAQAIVDGMASLFPNARVTVSGSTASFYDESADGRMCAIVKSGRTVLLASGITEITVSSKAGQACKFGPE